LVGDFFQLPPLKGLPLFAEGQGLGIDDFLVAPLKTQMRVTGVSAVSIGLCVEKDTMEAVLAVVSATNHAAIVRPKGD
jgi:hypothetical protein